MLFSKLIPLFGIFASVYSALAEFGANLNPAEYMKRSYVDKREPAGVSSLACF